MAYQAAVAQTTEKQKAAHFSVNFVESKGIKGGLNFLQVSGIEQILELETIEGTSGATWVRRGCRPGVVRLTHGSGHIDSEFMKWVEDSLDPNKRLERRDVEIKLQKPKTSAPAGRIFILKDAYPCEWHGPLLNTGLDNLVVDTLAIAYSRMTEKGQDSSASQSNEQKKEMPCIRDLNDDSKQVTFAAQPERLIIRHGAEFVAHAGPGMQRPKVDFEQARQRTLDAQFTVDWDLGDEHLKTPKQIYEQIDVLEGFLKVNPETLETPLLIFSAGGREFKGYLADLQVDVNKFNEKGQPLRVNYSITMIESFDAKDVDHKKTL